VGAHARSTLAFALGAILAGILGVFMANRIRLRTKCSGQSRSESDGIDAGARRKEQTVSSIRGDM